MIFVGLISPGPFEIWFSYHEHESSLAHVQRDQAETAALKIGHFIKEIEDQIGWVTQLPWSEPLLEDRRFDGQRLMRQVPTITELVQLDPRGREQLRLSRVTRDVIGSQSDFSEDLRFIEAIAHKTYYSPIYFRYQSEPYMSMAKAGTRPEDGVTIAEINLKLIDEIVSQIKVGKGGQAYVVGGKGMLIAHSDISLVLNNTDLSELPQVRWAREQGETHSLPVHLQTARDLQGREVLAAYALVAPLRWLVFVELPIDEAYAPIRSLMLRSSALLVVGFALAIAISLLFARRMVVPIRALRRGAARIGSGDLSQRIAIKTEDELEELSRQFNRMAAQLQESYATLEAKVEERTNQLELANQAKSRFIAAASHDLRQPLHALGLFVAQLRACRDAGEREHIIGRILAAIGEMNALFNELLDISRLDAGGLTAEFTEFPIAQVLQRVETTFAQMAQEKGLALRIIPSSAWVRSDLTLLSRILLNLVANAVNYTAHGRVIVGCRRRAETLRIEVWDSGPGIPEDQRDKIFGEFYRVSGQAGPGLGLGLAIVDRLSRLLDHPIDLISTVGKGSCFAVTAPAVGAKAKSVEPPPVADTATEAATGKRVLVVDDDMRALEGIGSLLRSWGCSVVDVRSFGAALAQTDEHPPSLIISDYHLAGDGTGIDLIERLRCEFDTKIPAFLISGDMAPECRQRVSAGGYILLHKPVDPMTLRATVDRFLRTRADPERTRAATAL